MVRLRSAMASARLVAANREALPDRDGVERKLQEERHPRRVGLYSCDCQTEADAGTNVV